MLSVLLIRHAESEINAADPPVVGGRSSWCELTPTGVAQARVLGQRLRGVPCDRVVASPAVRAQQTARYCLEALPDLPLRRIELAAELLELHQGDWENRRRSEIYTPEIQAIIDRDPWSFRAPGGESQADVFERARTWLDRQPNGHLWVFGHGVVTKVLIAGLFGLDRRTAWKIPIDNTSVTRMERRDGAWSSTP